MCQNLVVSWRSWELSGTERQTAERCWQRDKTVHCSGRRALEEQRTDSNKTSPRYIQMAQKCVAPTEHRADGTGIYGTNMAPYRMHSKVWHQQCAVVGTVKFSNKIAQYRWHSNVWHQQCIVLWFDNSDRDVQLLVAKRWNVIRVIVHAGGDAVFVYSSLLIFKHCYKLMAVKTICENDSRWRKDTYRNLTARCVTASRNNT